MTKIELKQNHPDTYSEIFAEGVALEKAKSLETINELEQKLEQELQSKKAFDFKLN